MNLISLETFLKIIAAKEVMIVFSKLNTIKIEHNGFCALIYAAEELLLVLRCLILGVLQILGTKGIYAAADTIQIKKHHPSKREPQMLHPSLELFKFWGINKNN